MADLVQDSELAGSGAPAPAASARVRRAGGPLAPAWQAVRDEVVHSALRPLASGLREWRAERLSGFLAVIAAFVGRGARASANRWRTLSRAVQAGIAALAVLLLAGIVVLIAEAGSADYRVVRTVGDIRLVVIPKEATDTPSLFRVADLVCLQAVNCGVQFWTDRALVPKSGLPQGDNLAARVASYWRHRNAKRDELIRADAAKIIYR